MSETVTKRIYFVRHGETEGNLSKFFQFPETELSPTGLRGAKAVAERFGHLEVDVLVASPFTRAQQTAGYISGVVGKPVTTVESFHEALRPHELRGVSHHSEPGQAHIAEYESEYWTETWRPAGAENYKDVLSRVAKSVDFLEKANETNIVVVSHGAFIKMITSFLILKKKTDLPYIQDVFYSLVSMSNAAITEFEYENGDWRLMMWNDHAHFAEN